MRFLTCLSLLSLLAMSGCPDSSPKVPDEPQVKILTEPPFTLEKDYTQLTMDYFETFPADETPFRYVTEDDTIQVNMGQRGFMYTKESYDDFVLKGDLMFIKVDMMKGGWPHSNGGFLVYVQEPDEIWPTSLEVQGKFFEMGQIKANGEAAEPEIIRDDAQMRELVRQPMGEWNSFEIQSEDGALKVFLNGQEIAASKAGELKEGRIALQAEGTLALYRRIRIRTGPPPKPASSPGMGG